MYLFVPLCCHVRESDFIQNLRLDNGKKIWKALWEFKQPDIESFTAHVRIIIIKKHTDRRTKKNKKLNDTIRETACR